MAENNKLQRDTGKGADRLAGALANVLTQEAQRQQAMQAMQQQQAMIEAQRQFQAMQQAKEQQFQMAVEQGKQAFEKRIFDEEMKRRREQQIQNQSNADREFNLQKKDLEFRQKTQKMEQDRLNQAIRAGQLQYYQGITSMIDNLLTNPNVLLPDGYQSDLLKYRQDLVQRVGKEFNFDFSPTPPAVVPPAAPAPKGVGLFDKAWNFFGFGDNAKTDSTNTLGSKAASLFDKPTENGAGRSF